MNFYEKAHQPAEWICNNQHDHSAECVPDKNDELNMVEDMNYGRFVRNYNITERKIIHYSTNWISGMTIYGLLLLHDYFKVERYKDAAIKGSFYLCCLQNTLENSPDAYGSFNERSPANRWGSCRDGLSAAWSMLRLYRSTGKEEFLQRAELYADWHMKYGIKDGFPIAYYLFDEHRSKDLLANCQGGSALYYFDLYEQTGKEEYRRVMLKIVDLYMEYFFNEDGSIAIIYDPATGYKGDAKESPAWSDMHKFNDDFGALAILAAYVITGDKKYLDHTVRYLEWVLTQQHADGSFGKFSLSVSSCVAALNLMNVYLITGNEKFKKSAYKAMEHLEQFVVKAPEDPVINGAILGMEVCGVSKKNDIISLRVTMYAMYTCLLSGLYEDKIQSEKKDEIPESVIKNPMLIGLRYL